MDGTPNKSPFHRNSVVDRDQAILFLKKVGYEATDDPDIFQREENRLTHEKAAGVRHLTTVSLNALLSDRKRYDRFCRAWSKKVSP